MRRISNKMTIFALTNGMIGGVILVIPVLALSTGTMLIPIISFICGIASFYTAWLSIRHLKNSDSMDQAVLEHFDNKPIYPVIYNFVMAISMTSLLFLFFDLLNIQISGLIHFYSQSEQSTQQTPEYLVPWAIAISLLFIVIPIRKLSIGAHLMAYGVISIVIYCAFLIWVLASSPYQYDHTSNQGQTQITVSVMPLADKQFIRLAAHLGMGYAIHNFMVPILKRNKNVAAYAKILSIVYVLGFFIYTYIAYSAFGILNRKPPQNRPNSIEDYFEDSQGNASWEVAFIQMIYTFHLLSVFPQFLIIAKSRYFAIFRGKMVTQATFIEQQNRAENKPQEWIQQPDEKNKNAMEQNQDKRSDQGSSNKKGNQQGINSSKKMANNCQQTNENSDKQDFIPKKQYYFYVFFLASCLILRLGGVQVVMIAEFNGAVIVFLYVYLVPIIIHLKCVYFTDHDELKPLTRGNIHKNREEQIKYENNEVQLKNEQNFQGNKDCQKEEFHGQRVIESFKDQESAELHGYCKIVYDSKWLKRGQLIIVMLVIGVGIFTMLYTLGKMLQIID